MAFSDKKAALDYINNYQKEKYQSAAKAKGLSLSAFIMECVDKCIENM